MAELIDAPIVDIRKVGSVKSAIAYVAKYITKAPAQFGSRKRYWLSKNYELDKWEPSADDGAATVKWQVERTRLYDLVILWWQQGYTARPYRDDIVYMLPRWLDQQE